MTAESPSTTDATEFCAFSKREDGKHTWNFDGDDPYVICAFCDRMQDAINGRVIRPGRVPEFKETAEDLNTVTDVQESPAPSTTDRLAEAAPLSDEELALMERLWAGHQTYVRQLLDEVYRLRARLDTAEGRLATVRSLPQIEIGRYWNSHSEAQAQGRNATLLEVQQILDGGAPPRADLTQTEVRNRFQRHIAALGLDEETPDV